MVKDYTGKSVPANLFRGIEGVGGMITFYPDAMVFHAHALNIQTGDTVIPYIQIADVQKRNTAVLIPNGMSVITKQGENYRFVVYNRSKLIDFLLSKRS